MNFSLLQIQQMLPQKHPFIFIDEVKSVEKGTCGIGIKRLKNMDAIFKCHFPDNPILPACIQIEMMAQTAIMVILSKYSTPKEYRNMEARLLSVERARFYEEIKPNNILKIHVKRMKTVNQIHYFLGEIFCRNKLCAQAHFSAIQRDKNICCKKN